MNEIEEAAFKMGRRDGQYDLERFSAISPEYKTLYEDGYAEGQSTRSRDLALWTVQGEKSAN